MSPYVSIKLVILLGLVLATAVTAVAGPAPAASAEDAYFAARDAAIARFKALDDAHQADDAATRAHDEALADLRRLMLAVTGPVTASGLPGPDAINLGTLYPGDQGFGTLDGLVFGAPDHKSSVIVTTEAVLTRWLKAHRDWWGERSAPMPQDPAAAIKTDAFYTQAIQTDAAVMRFGELPLARMGKAKLVYAALAARSQSEAPRAPDELLLVAIRDGKVFLANAPLQRAFAPVPACDQVRSRGEAAAERLFSAYQAGGRRNEGLFDRYTAARASAEKAFLRCFAQRARGQPAFAAARRQAEVLRDKLLAAN